MQETEIPSLELNLRPHHLLDSSNLVRNILTKKLAMKNVTRRLCPSRIVEIYPEVFSSKASPVMAMATRDSQLDISRTCSQTCIVRPVLRRSRHRAAANWSLDIWLFF